MSRIVLIRPGQTDYAADSRLLGMLEMPINQAGLLEVQQVLAQISASDLKLEALFTTPGDPAFGTARAISEQLDGLRIRQLDELRNVDQGLWQGLPESQVRKRYPRLFRSCREKPQAICAPEGESLSEACERVARVLNRAIRKYEVFGIVAVEPIATVIRCTLQQRGPTLASCLCGEDRKLVECFEASEFDPGAFVNFECVPDTIEATTGAAGPGRH
ncbi:MAG: phosphoglycerate mutase family protein [Fuerstiella sp.]|nr:phosphoglycerate mutase family protein [Fuerstiella sp.]